jgi:hypothetical protein
VSLAVRALYYRYDFNFNDFPFHAAAYKNLSIFTSAQTLDSAPTRDERSGCVTPVKVQSCAPAVAKTYSNKQNMILMNSAQVRETQKWLPRVLQVRKTSQGRAFESARTVANGSTTIFRWRS